MELVLISFSSMIILSIIIGIIYFIFKPFDKPKSQIPPTSSQPQIQTPPTSSQPQIPKYYILRESKRHSSIGKNTGTTFEMNCDESNYVNGIYGATNGNKLKNLTISCKGKDYALGKLNNGFIGNTNIDINLNDKIFTKSNLDGYSNLFISLDNENNIRNIGTTGDIGFDNQEYGTNKQNFICENGKIMGLYGNLDNNKINSLGVICGIEEEETLENIEKIKEEQKKQENELKQTLATKWNETHRLVERGNPNITNARTFENKCDNGYINQIYGYETPTGLTSIGFTCNTNSLKYNSYLSNAESNFSKIKEDGFNGLYISSGDSPKIAIKSTSYGWGSPSETISYIDRNYTYTKIDTVGDGYLSFAGNRSNFDDKQYHYCGKDSKIIGLYGKTKDMIRTKYVAGTTILQTPELTVSNLGIICGKKN